MFRIKASEAIQEINDILTQGKDERLLVEIYNQVSSSRIVVVGRIMVFFEVGDRVSFVDTRPSYYRTGPNKTLTGTITEFFESQLHCVRVKIDNPEDEYTEHSMWINDIRKINES